MQQRPFKIIFAGTPEFAVPTLQALLNSPHQIIAVYTQPDRPSGRGKKLNASPVKALAQTYHVPIHQPLNFRAAEDQATLKHLNADLMIVVAYGIILPQEILTAPRYGCINIHASLLPRWRGAAPIQRAILAGDNETGITIMQMDAGLDTGPMLAQQPCPILPSDTSEDLQQRLMTIANPLLLQVLQQLGNSRLKPQPQNNAQATYAKKIEKNETQIDWHQSAEEIDRLIRAFNPRPIAYTFLADQIIKIWQAEVIAEKTKALTGTILHVSKQGIDVATGKNILRLLKIQLAGGRCLDVAEILNAKKEWFKTQHRLGV